MSTTNQEVIYIGLIAIPEREEAVIHRVITFGATQGKPYTLNPDLNQAHILITADDNALISSQAVSIRIGESSTAADITLARPLLVTRVMRALDDASHLLQSRPKQSNTTGIPLPNSSITDDVIDLVPMIESKPTNITTTSTPDPATATSIETTPPTLEPNTEKQYLALVVDDSAAIRKQLELELQNANIKAEFAETGEQALEKSQQTQYDLIFLDIVLPGIDGFEVCRQMRTRKTMKKTPIIMLSGKTSPLDEVQGVIAGASTYLTKPVKHEQFQQTLTRVSKWLSNFAR